MRSLEIARTLAPALAACALCGRRSLQSASVVVVVSCAGTHNVMYKAVWKSLRSDETYVWSVCMVWGTRHSAHIADGRVQVPCLDVSTDPVTLVLLSWGVTEFVTALQAPADRCAALRRAAPRCAAIPFHARKRLQALLQNTTDRTSERASARGEEACVRACVLARADKMIGQMTYLRAFLSEARRRMPISSRGTSRHRALPACPASDIPLPSCSLQRSLACCMLHACN